MKNGKGLPFRRIYVCSITLQTPSEYEAQYNKLRNKEYSRFHGYAYDGIWTLALAVHNVINKLRAQETPGSSTKVTDFQYRNNTWGRLFREALNETDFTGVTVNSILFLYVIIPADRYCY